MPRHKNYIRLKYSEEVFRGGRHWPPGYYVWFRGTSAWEAVEQLRFAREKDGQLAMRALVASGITTKRKLIEAGEQALMTAFEALQW